MVSAQATGLMVRIIPVADNTATFTMKPSASPSLADVKAIRRRVTSAVEATVTFFKSSSPVWRPRLSCVARSNFVVLPGQNSCVRFYLRKLSA